MLKNKLLIKIDFREFEDASYVIPGNKFNLYSNEQIWEFKAKRENINVVPLITLHKIKT